MSGWYQPSVVCVQVCVIQSDTEQRPNTMFIFPLWLPERIQTLALLPQHSDTHLLTGSPNTLSRIQSLPLALSTTVYLRDLPQLTSMAYRTCMTLHINWRSCETENILSGSLLFGSTGPRVLFCICSLLHQDASAKRPFLRLLSCAPILPCEFQFVFHVASTGMFPSWTESFELQILFPLSCDSDSTAHSGQCTTLTPKLSCWRPSLGMSKWGSKEPPKQGKLLTLVPKGWGRPAMQVPVS